jgi:drug/metabolite transporter (DMT)-like permease
MMVARGALATERIEMQPMRSTRAAGMLVFTTLAWGAMFAVAKTALGALDAFWLSLWRYVPAALLMVIILRVVEGRRALSFDGAGVRLWLYGSLGFAGFSILGFLGLSQSRPEHAAIIVALMPLITSLINWAVRGQRPSPLTFGAIVVALAGVVLVITHGHLRLAAEGTLHADAMVLAGVICWVGYTMAAATLPGFSALRYTAHSMALGSASIVMVTIAATIAGVAHPPALAVVASVPVEIAYLSLIGGVLAVLAWNAGVGVLGSANGVLFINLVPITAFAIGVAQGHRFGAAELSGVLLVVGALVVNNVATREPRGIAQAPAKAGGIRPARSPA